MHDKITYWRDSAIDGLEICMVRNSRHNFPKHSHDSVYTVGMMVDGACYSLGPGRDDSLVTSGQIALINPGQVHSGVPAPDTAVTYHTLYLDISLMRTVAEELNHSHDTLPEFNTIVINDSVLGQKLFQFCTSVTSQAGQLEKESLLFDAIGQLLSAYAGVSTAKNMSSNHPRAVRLAKAYLTANLDHKMTLEHLARVVGLSRYHLLRIFKQHTGLPPHLYRTQRRIDLAKSLLLKGMPFAQVALATGFADQSHFTNKFKQFTAATPSQYLYANSLTSSQPQLKRNNIQDSLYT